MLSLTTFGQRLKAARGAKRLSQQDLARLINVRQAGRTTAKQLSEYERDARAYILLTLLPPLADILEVSLDWLFLGRD